LLFDYAGNIAGKSYSGYTKQYYEVLRRLFLACAREVAKGYPDIDLKIELLTTCACSWTKTELYDVIVAPIFTAYISPTFVPDWQRLGVAPGAN